MYQSVVPKVLEKYGLDVLTIKPAQKGYRSESYPIHLSDGNTANLIFFKREENSLRRITRADTAAHLAGEAGLPVRTRYDKRILKVAADSYAGIYHYLPGTTVPWESFTMKHIKLLGMAMGDLHSVLRQAVPADSYTVMDEFLPIISRMEVYFSDEDVRRAMAEKLGLDIEIPSLSRLKKVIAYVSELPGQQLLHMDMVRGNVLFNTPLPTDRWQIDDLALTGIIDFEKTAVGHPLFDLARTLAFLIVDCPKPADKVYRYFLDSGYCKRGGQPQPDPILLTALIKFFLLHDFYKFLRHTPYESLHDNYHYTRTVNVLLQYGIISLKH